MLLPSSLLASKSVGHSMPDCGVLLQKPIRTIYTVHKQIEIVFLWTPVMILFRVTMLLEEANELVPGQRGFTRLQIKTSAQ